MTKRKIKYRDTNELSISGMQSIFNHLWFKVKTNTKYKDRLFIKLFGNKEQMLSLYNALNGSNYTDTSKLFITTIDDIVYMGFKNDVSFIIENYLNLYEHQSIYSPNMPLRGLNYFTDIYRAYIRKNDLNIYGSALVKLPTPRYIVFYNGEMPLPNNADKHELKLSDAFEGENACLECVATVYNINLGHNKDLMQSCTTLSQYAQLVDKVRFYRKQGYSNGKAIDMAVEYCIENDILRDFLVKNRSEVYHMFDFDHDIRKYHKLVLRNIKKLQEEVAEKEDVIVKKDDMIAEKDNVIAEKDIHLAEKDDVIAEKDNALAEKDAKIKALEEMLAKQVK